MCSAVFLSFLSKLSKSSGLGWHLCMDLDIGRPVSDLGRDCKGGCMLLASCKASTRGGGRGKPSSRTKVFFFFLLHLLFGALTVSAQNQNQRV